MHYTLKDWAALSISPLSIWCSASLLGEPFLVSFELPFLLLDEEAEPRPAFAREPSRLGDGRGGLADAREVCRDERGSLGDGSGPEGRDFWARFGVAGACFTAVALAVDLACPERALEGVAGVGAG
jgi:hypothetical protein